MFDFGKQLKDLRNAKGLTQEQVAELLNVSKQSVSRWENNVTYPDITFLPTLASFFGVTVDALLGADYETNAQAKKQCLSKRHNAHNSGDIRAAYELSQELYSRFPNDLTVINAMMTDSYLMGLHDAGGGRRHYLEMSIAVSERFMKMTEDIEESCRCIRNIAACHKLLGNNEAAVLWMNKLPSMWSGIEHTALSVLEGEEREASVRRSLDAALNLIYRLIYESSQRQNLSAAQRIMILEKIPVMFGLLLENGDYGFYHGFLSRTYLELAKCCLPDREKAIACIESASEHACKMDGAQPSEHKSILFLGERISPDEWTRSGAGAREKLLNALESSEFDVIRGDTGFVAAVSSLKNG